MQPHTTYFICATPRSGTVLLRDALTATGVAGYPEEYFLQRGEPDWVARWGLAECSYGDYLEAALEHGSTPNGVFGAKMMWTTFEHFACRLQQIPRYASGDVPAALDAAFPDLRYIWLTRRDKVAQAVSHWKGLQTGIWHLTAGESRIPAATPTYCFEAIERLVEEAENHDAAWQNYFKARGIQPLAVVYEDFVDAYEATIDRILAFLGVQPCPARLGMPRTVKTADSVSGEWCRLYRCTLPSPIEQLATG